MKVTKEKGEFSLNVFLEEDGKYISFTYGGNGDLYWSIHNKSKLEEPEYNYDFFTITKENYGIYSLFEQLFSDIENINIFNEDDIPFYIETEEEKREYLEKRREEHETLKKRFRLFNKSHYNDLYDEDEKTITWHSDETASEVSNILKIKKEQDSFKVEFFTQPHIEGYFEDFHYLGSIPIRFRNSGSSYDPFNLVFMKMYNSMGEIDDVDDIGHQMHIEEYLYTINKVKKR